MSSLSSASAQPQSGSHDANGRVPSPLPPTASASPPAAAAAAAPAASPAAVLASWTPAPAELRLVLSLLSDPQHGSAASQSHYAQLEQLRAYPEFSNYLAYILACCRSEPATMRAKAGLQLKNLVKEGWERMSGAQQEYIKAAVIESMSAERALQHIIGTITANIAVRCRIVGWPGILQHLIAALDAADADLQAVAFNAVAKICEDAADADLQAVAFNAVAKICEDAGAELIADDAALGRPLHYLIPKLIACFHHPRCELRVAALTAVNVFLYLMPLVMRMHLDAALAALFATAWQDGDAEVRKRVCQAFVVLLENKNGHDRPLQPHLDGVIQFMLHACNDSDDSVALEASEFWSAYCDTRKDDHTQHNGDIQLLARYLHPLTATLLKGMRLADDDQLDDEDDAQVPDRQQDIRPTVHRSRTQHYEGAAVSSSGGGGSAAAAAAAAPGDAAPHGSSGGWGGGEYSPGSSESSDEDDLLDDDSFDGSEEVANWNLRKCSASALDSLANTYGSVLFAHLLPLLKDLLSPHPSPGVSAAAGGQPAVEQWVLRESGILALGAVAEGSFDAIEPHLPELVPYLLSFLRDARPLVRSITCWTLSRYSKWVVREPASTFFQPLLEGLLASILDPNKAVQEAACSAFATFEEEAGLRLSEHLPRILHFLMHAFGAYQQKNMLILYDAIGTLAESVGDMLNQPACVALLMPPLMARWQQLSDDDRAIFPLFECLGNVATALCDGFKPYAQPVVQRCLNIIQRTLDQQKAADHHNQLDPHTNQPHADYHYVDLEFVVAALDLLSGVTEGLAHHIEPLIPNSSVMQLLYQCFTERDTRLLTADGFLFYDEIQQRAQRGQRVLYACYDVASGGLVYRSGKLVEPAAPDYLVDFSSPGEARRWQAAAAQADEECSDSDSDSGSGGGDGGCVSLRVTPQHRMYVQSGDVTDHGEFIPLRSSSDACSDTPHPFFITPAADLLCCSCPSAHCRHRASHIRFTACAAAGHVDAVPSRRRSHIQRQLHLSDERFVAFAELYGYWLLGGSLDRVGRAVCFDALRGGDGGWLRGALAAAGLPSTYCAFSRCCGGGEDAGERAVVTSDAWYACFEAEVDAASERGEDARTAPRAASPTVRSRSPSSASDADSDDERSATAEATSASAARSIPQWVLLSLSAAELRPFIRGMQRASQAAGGKAGECIVTCSGQLRDQLLQLLLHAGYTALARRDGGAWAVEWTSAVNSDGTANAAAQRLCQPLVDRAAGGVSRVAYSAERDGRVWCVTVDHPDHLVVAQRAERVAGAVVRMSRPVVVGQCMSDRDPDVRQSAFALLGDLAKAACAHLLPYLSWFLPLCAINLNPHYSSVCNNASWAVGEIAIRAGREPLLPHVEPLMQYLILILCPPPQPNGQQPHAPSPKVSASLLENASITIGRLGLVCPQPVAARLSEYAAVWFAQLERLRDNAEKEHAYHGMCSLVESNPTAVLGNVPALLSAVCSWRAMGNERMVARLRSLLHNFKVAFEGQGERGVQQWNAALAAMTDDKRRVLSTAFGV